MDFKRTISMKSMEKVILFFEKCIFTLYGLVKILMNTRFIQKKEIPKTKDEFCYILGTGPSLRKDFLERNVYVDIENLIAVNNFVCSEWYDKIKPKFYVLADPAYYVDNLDQQLQMNIHNLFVELKEKTNWPLILFVPFEGKKRIRELLKANGHISVVGYNKVNTWKGFKWFDRWVYNNQWAIVSGLNVVMAALSLSINMGFKKIYLFGVDHSWHKNLVMRDDNTLCWYYSHFYDEKDNENLELIPVYLEENNQIKCLKMHELLDSMGKAFQVYHFIENYAKHKKIKIYNCTSNSFIDAFERKDLNK